MDFGLIALGADLLKSYFGSRSQKKALDRYMQMISPGVQAGQGALKAGIGAGRAILGESMSRLGKPSRLLRSQYEQAATGTARAGEASARKSRLYYARYGNVGRARGEEMRAKTETRRSLNELALGYGGAQEQYGLANRQSALQATGMMGNLAQVGLAPLGQAAEGAWAQGMAGGDLLSDIFGSLGQWGMYQQWQKQRNPSKADQTANKVA